MRSKLFLIILLIFSVLTSLLACTNNEQDKYTEKESYQVIIDNTNNQPVKSVNTVTNVKFVFYKYDGTPCRITENINLNRIVDEQRQYIYLEAQTSEISKYVQDLVNAVVSFMQMSGNEKPLVAMQDYLFGRKFVALKAGKYLDTVNAQVELVEKAEMPTFNYSDDGQELVDFKAAWGAVKYSDFVEFQDTAEVEYIKDFDVLGNMFDVFTLPFDWSKSVDVFDNQPMEYNGVELTAYNLTLSSTEIINFIKKKAQFFISEFLKDNQEDFDFVNGIYNRNIDKLLGMFSIGHFNQLAYIDEANRLQHTETSWQIDLNLDISVIKDILLSEGVSQENVDQVIRMLDLLNSTFISNSTKQKGKFEFSLLFDIKEDYSYDNISIDTNDSIFTDFASNELGRYTIQYVYDEEKNSKRWIPFNIPQKLQEMLDDDKEPDIDKDDEIIVP